jgi:hypothetical protein
MHHLGPSRPFLVQKTKLQSSDQEFSALVQATHNDIEAILEAMFACLRFVSMAHDSLAQTTNINSEYK